MLNLSSIMINSPDFKQLGDFYGKVLQKEPAMNDLEHNMIGYDAGNCFLTFCPHDKVTGANPNPERVLFFFETADVKTEFDRIVQIPGATVVAEPYSPGGNDSYSIATIADPDGNYFQLCLPWDGQA